MRGAEGVGMRNAVESASGGAEKKSFLKSNRFWSYVVVVVVILAAVIISLLFYRQKIETVKLKNITEDWQTFTSDKYHFSFKYPGGNWSVHEAGSSTWEIAGPSGYVMDFINLRVSSDRVVNTSEPTDAIQISIPFDKKNYLIFSTSTNNRQKEIFYNIPVTLEIGK